MSKDPEKKLEMAKQPVTTPPPPAPLELPQRPKRLFRSIDWWTFAATTFVVLIGYLWTVAPDLTLEDSGELAVGSYYAGVPHPPGYPVWTIYTWLFTKLLPFSNIAWRVAVSSAVAGAFSCGLLSLMVSRGSSMMIESIDEFRNIERKWENAICIVCGFVAGMMFGFNGFMWSQSVIVEVYTFSVLSFVGMLALLMRWTYEPEKRRYLYGAFFLFGICFTNHQTLIVAAMGIQVLIAMIRPRLGRDLFLMNSIVFILGLIAKSSGMLTAFDENAALFRIYLFVGTGSLIAWGWLAYETMKVDDWFVLLTDVLMTISLGYLVLLVFTAGGYFSELPNLARLAGLGAISGFLVLTWKPTKGEMKPAIELARIILICLVGIYTVCLMTTSPTSFNWLNRTPGVFVTFNLFGLVSVVALGVTIRKFHTYGKLFFPIYAMGGLWALALCTHFYMPIASMTNPPMNWAYPREVGGFFHSLFRGQYQATQPTDSVGRLADQIVNLFLDGAREEFTLVFLAIGLVVFFYIGKMKWRERSWIVGLTSIFVCLSLLLLMLLNPGTDQLSKDLTKVFFTASHLMIAMGIGYGLALIATTIITSYEKYRHYLLIGACIVAGVALLEMTTKLEEIKYDLVQFAYTLVLILSAGFAIVILYKKENAPKVPILIASLVLFVLTPIFSITAHWADNEQRRHLFGFWFGHDMFDPPFEIYEPMAENAILFGGTDPGRFAPTYMIFAESFIPNSKKRDPDFDRRDVYIITQNALADGTYLQYIRAHYNRSTQFDRPFFQDFLRPAEERGLNRRTNVLARAVEPLDTFFTNLGAEIEKKRREKGVYPEEEIYIPTNSDLSWAYSTYEADLMRRLQLGQIRPGENVSQLPDGRISFTGQTSVMAINGLLARILFDQNPDHEFYIEESFPLEWMKPYLLPYGIIMKINREPVAEWTQEIVDRDHQFWTQYSDRLIGNWIDYDTPLEEVLDFTLKAFVQKDHSDFPGDPKFARDKQAQKTFSKLRSSLAGVYDWRWRNAKTDDEQARMLKEAEFAYKQAFAFYPGSPEAIANYSNLLISTGRIDDAILVCSTSLEADPNNFLAADLLRQLRAYKENNPQVSGATYEQMQANINTMEQLFEGDPLNLTNALNLVSGYYSLGQTNDGMQVLDAMLANTNSDSTTILTLASTFSQLGAFTRLEKSLLRLVELEPESPEGWYDLAAIQAVGGQAPASLQSLKRALELNDARIKSDPTADQLRNDLANDPRFLGLKDLPEYEREIGQ